MNNYSFTNDNKSRQFTDRVAQCIVENYHISEFEAITFLELTWANVPFDGIFDLRYHELPSEWAKRIYDYHSTKQ